MGMHAAYNFPISAAGPVSLEFLRRNISDFQAALQFIGNLPYGRNKSRSNFIALFAENCGTCSTKHALLKQLALENSADSVTLIIGLLKMNAANTPAVAATLSGAKLEYMPEAHCYLRINGAITDVMKASSTPDDFINDLLEETSVEPEQVADYKVEYHRRFLERWLRENPEISYTLEELWSIREQCIRDLHD